MKKLLILLFSLLISFNSYGEWTQVSKDINNNTYYIDYKKINSIAVLLNKLDELELDYILFDDELIQSEIYIDLRKVITQSSVIVEHYESKIIKNRLTDKSVMSYLTLVKRIHD